MSPDQIAESVRLELLADWLLVQGYAEEKRGYGHVSADELAEALLARFDIRLRHNDGSRSGGEGG